MTPKLRENDTKASFVIVTDVLSYRNNSTTSKLSIIPFDLMIKETKRKKNSSPQILIATVSSRSLTNKYQIQPNQPPPSQMTKPFSLVIKDKEHSMWAHPREKSSVIPWFHIIIHMIHPFSPPLPYARDAPTQNLVTRQTALDDFLILS